MRLSPASDAAALKLSNDRVTPGSAGDVTANDWSSPKKLASTSAPAALIVLCAPGEEGAEGVLPASGSQFGSATVFGLASVSARRIAVTGLQSWYVYFAS